MCTCSSAGKVGQGNQVLVQLNRVLDHKRFHWSPAPACRAALHCQTSSIEHRFQPAGVETVPHSGGLGPAQSHGSPGSAAEVLLPESKSRKTFSLLCLALFYCLQIHSSVYHGHLTSFESVLFHLCYEMLSQMPFHLQKISKITLFPQTPSSLIFPTIFKPEPFSYSLGNKAEIGLLLIRGLSLVLPDSLLIKQPITQKQ